VQFIQLGRIAEAMPDIGVSGRDTQSLAHAVAPDHYRELLAVRLGIELKKAALDARQRCGKSV
jgi:hypothetical protein